jgi:hypothetical protein
MQQKVVFCREVVVHSNSATVSRRETLPSHTRWVGQKTRTVQMSDQMSKRSASQVQVIRARVSRWISVVVALVLLAASGGPARAGYQFGAEDRITKIVDLAMRSPKDEALYLGYKLKVYSFFAPVYFTNDGYVIGFADDNTRYIPLTAERIAALQRQGQLPTPLPPYALTLGDYAYGYLLWVILLGLGVIALIFAAIRRTGSAADRVPLTVAGMAARRNRSVLVSTALVLLPILAVVWLAHGMLLTVIRGPREATGADIIAAQARGDDHNWFVLADQLRDLNVNRLETWRDRQGHVQQTRYSLYVVPGSPGILLETASQSLEVPVYAWIASGSLHDPSNSSYTRGREAAERLGTTLAPFMLTGSNAPPVLARIGTAIVWTPVALVVVLLLRGLFRAMRGLHDPLKTWNVRYLLKSSRAAEGLDRLVREIDAQAARAKLSLTPYGNSLLPSWVIVNGALTFRLMSTEDVIWIAPYTVTRSSYGFKTGQHQQINVVDRFGRHIIFRVSDPNAAVRQIYSRAPWAVPGLDTEMQRAFGKARAKPLGWLTHRRLRAELVRDVDERRLAILAQVKAQAGQAG